MSKQMSKRKKLGLTVDVIVLISIFLTNDIAYLKFVGIFAILVLIGDILINKL